MAKYLNETGVQRILQKVDQRITQKIAQAGGGGGSPVGEVPGTLKIATFNAPCSNLLSVMQNSEGGWNIEIGFNVTDNQDGTVTLTDFDFSYDLDATFFRDYWMLMISEDSVDRYSVLSFLEALEGMGYVKPNYLFGMGILSVRGSSGYEYFGIIVLECPDESAKNDLLDLLSISYLQIGYAIPTVTDYEYSSPEMLRRSNRTMSLDEPKAAKKQTLIDKLNSILEAKKAKE